MKKTLTVTGQVILIFFTAALISQDNASPCASSKNRLIPFLRNAQVDIAMREWAGCGLRQDLDSPLAAMESTPPLTMHASFALMHARSIVLRMRGGNSEESSSAFDIEGHLQHEAPVPQQTPEDKDRWAVKKILPAEIEDSVVEEEERSRDNDQDEEEKRPKLTQRQKLEAKAAEKLAKLAAEGDDVDDEIMGGDDDDCVGGRGHEDLSQARAASWREKETGKRGERRDREEERAGDGKRHRGESDGDKKQMGGLRGLKSTGRGREGGGRAKKQQEEDEEKQEGDISSDLVGYDEHPESESASNPYGMDAPEPDFTHRGKDLSRLKKRKGFEYGENYFPSVGEESEDDGKNLFELDSNLSEVLGGRGTEGDEVDEEGGRRSSTESVDTKQRMKDEGVKDKIREVKSARQTAGQPESETESHKIQFSTDKKLGQTHKPSQSSERESSSSVSVKYAKTKSTSSRKMRPLQCSAQDDSGSNLNSERGKTNKSKSKRSKAASSSKPESVSSKSTKRAKSDLLSNEHTAADGHKRKLSNSKRDSHTQADKKRSKGQESADTSDERYSPKSTQVNQALESSGKIRVNQEKYRSTREVHPDAATSSKKIQTDAAEKSSEDSGIHHKAELKESDEQTFADLERRLEAGEFGEFSPGDLQKIALVAEKMKNLSKSVGEVTGKC